MWYDAFQVCQFDSIITLLTTQQTNKLTATEDTSFATRNMLSNIQRKSNGIILCCYVSNDIIISHFDIEWFLALIFFQSIFRYFFHQFHFVFFSLEYLAFETARTQRNTKNISFAWTDCRMCGFPSHKLHIQSTVVVKRTIFLFSSSQYSSRRCVWICVCLLFRVIGI